MIKKLIEITKNINSVKFKFIVYSKYIYVTSPCTKTIYFMLMGIKKHWI